MGTAALYTFHVAVVELYSGTVQDTSSEERVARKLITTFVWALYCSQVKFLCRAENLLAALMPVKAMLNPNREQSIQNGAMFVTAA